MSIVIEIEGLDKLVDSLKRYPAIAIKHTDLAIQKSLTKIRKEVADEAPRGATGFLRAKWNIEKRPLFGKLSSGASSKGAFYGSNVEFGTSPHYVSPEQLQGWAKTKGLNPYAVSKSIQKKGTKANPFFSRGVDQSRQEVDRIFDEALSAIIQEI
jgi:hypothetical protein